MRAYLSVRLAGYAETLKLAVLRCIVKLTSNGIKRLTRDDGLAVRQRQVQSRSTRDTVAPVPRIPSSPTVLARSANATVRPAPR